MIILMHSSKTMRPPGPAAEPREPEPREPEPEPHGAEHPERATEPDAVESSERPDLSDSSGRTDSQEYAPRPLGTPVLLDRAAELVECLRALSNDQIAELMSVSPDLAEKTSLLYSQWSRDPDLQTPAAMTFVGDLYSGLRIDSFDAADRRYADERLRILSGLYGLLRPFDGVCRYRLEMGYRLRVGDRTNLYRYWGTSIVEQLPSSGRIVNLAANEYSKVVLPYVDMARVVTPKFFTLDPATGRPKFVVVHAKIARGAFARWLLLGRVCDKTDELRRFCDIGYRYSDELSTESEPAFVCEQFGGKGLSIRLG